MDESGGFLLIFASVRRRHDTVSKGGRETTTLGRSVGRSRGPGRLKQAIKQLCKEESGTSYKPNHHAIKMKNEKENGKGKGKGKITRCVSNSCALML
jgi:hypothetical protein